MKARVIFPLLLRALTAVLVFMLTGRVTAQTFTTLHSFTARYYNSAVGSATNSDGADPYAGLVLMGNALYGTASYGGSSDNGTVFKVNTDGSGFTNLHNFTAVHYNGSCCDTNSDGANPEAGLILSGNTLYGTASNGGNSGYGTVFKVNTDGSGFTNLHSFMTTSGSGLTNSDGYRPRGGLIISAHTLYGTAESGGISGYGTVFKVNTDGSGFAKLHDFTLPSGSPPTNSDGIRPRAGLVISGNTLYGMAPFGGSSDNGTVFKVNTDGSGFTNLHSFTAFPSFGPYTNSDGANPYAGLILSGNTLYGTAPNGGSLGYGTVFKVNTNGSGFTNLHSFNFSSGAFPFAGLILSGNTLYGTAVAGGSSNNGTVFKFNTDGTGFTNLHTFAGSPSDGANPSAALVLLGNTLYGTAVGGGSSGNGTVFRLSLPLPQLTIILSVTNVVLTWPSNYAGFDFTGFVLKTAPAITGTFTNIPGATSPYTNPITGAQKFFRLISN
ncbi:MAG: hypothetical protein HOP33_06660 [Verrucomicrobia bacterium]|nr:hypothetical protein [Verrucomicrobiota bacterium]